MTTIKAKFPALLVVDDDPSLLNALTEALKHEGFFPSGARSFAEGVSIIARGYIDIILTDLLLPDGLVASQTVDDGGLSLLQTYKQQTHVPIVVYTGIVGRDIAQRCVSGGASRYIAKPASVGEISQTLWDVIRHTYMRFQMEERL